MDLMMHSLIEPLTWQPSRKVIRKEYWGVGEVEFLTQKTQGEGSVVVG